MTKEWGFQLFSRLKHWNCLIFGTKVNLDNTYTLEMFKLFGKFLIPLILLKVRFFQLFFRLFHRNCLIFGTKVDIYNTYNTNIEVVWKIFNPL